MSFKKTINHSSYSKFLKTTLECRSRSTAHPVAIFGYIDYIGYTVDSVNLQNIPTIISLFAKNNRVSLI